MNDNDIRQLSRVLEEIRDNQKHQLERQQEALAIQREQFAIVQRQAERAERIQDRAQLMGSARAVVTILIPIVIALLVYVSWLIFR